MTGTTAYLPDDLLCSPDWPSRIDTIAAQHHVPGTQVGVLGSGQDRKPDVRVMVTGVTSLADSEDRR